MDKPDEPNIQSSSDSSSMEEDLIKNFQKMLIHPSNCIKDQLSSDLERLTMKQQSTDIQIFAFIFFRKGVKFVWETWLSNFLSTIRIQAEKQLFSKPRNEYFIVKLTVSSENASYLLLKIKQHIDDQQGVLCTFTPTYTLNVSLQETPIKIEHKGEDHIIVIKDGTPTKVFLLGSTLTANESDNLEYKQYQVSFLLSHKDTIMKHVCAFLNRGVIDSSVRSEGRLLIGIGKDKKSNAAIVCGLKASQKKTDQLFATINEGLQQLKVEKLVSVQPCWCGILSDQPDELYLIENMRMLLMISIISFEITIDPQSESIFYLRKGFYHYRSQQGLKNVPLQTLYELLKRKQINEEEYMTSLKVRDELEELLTNKKLKQNDN